MVSKFQQYNKIKNSTGGDSFGIFPEMTVPLNKRPSIIVPEGNIHLFYGNKWFGATHILQKHPNHFQDETEIPSFIEEILTPGIGTEVFCEELQYKIKPIILRRKIGQVVLEYRDGDYPHYSVVTAFPIYYSRNLGKKIGEF